MNNYENGTVSFEDKGYWVETLITKAVEKIKEKGDKLSKSQIEEYKMGFLIGFSRTKKKKEHNFEGTGSLYETGYKEGIYSCENCEKIIEKLEKEEELNLEEETNIRRR